MNTEKKKRFIMNLCMIAVVVGAVFSFPRIAKVTNTVNGRKLPIYSVETNKKQIALTFDASWGNADTEKILEILKKYNVCVTFFMTGGWVEKYPQDVKRIQEAGHDLGNHSENHKTMSQLSDAECQEEILKVHKNVKDLTGVEMNLFRAPYGDYDDHVIQNAEKCGYDTVQWSIDSLDWKDYGTENIIKTVLENEELKNGAIVLMHNSAKYTKDALETIIVGLQEKGYEIVPVSQLIYREDYHLDVTGRQMKN